MQLFSDEMYKKSDYRMEVTSYIIISIQQYYQVEAPGVKERGSISISS